MKRFRFTVFMLSILAVNAAHAQSAASAGVDAQSDQKAFYSLSADGAVQIGPDGRVSDYRMEGNLQPAVADLVKRAVMGWQFDPIVVDGKPVVAKTAMHLVLRAEPAAGKDDEFSVHIQSIHFGNPVRRGKGTAPQYPRAAASARLGAYVMLSARLDENGHVAEVVPYQTSLDAHAPTEKQAGKWRSLFEKAAIKAARTWQFDLTEVVDGRATGGYVAIPVQFFMSNTRNPGNDWRGYEAGPVNPPPWAAALQDQRVAQSSEGATSTSSRFHLKDDVIGKAL